MLQNLVWGQFLKLNTSLTLKPYVHLTESLLFYRYFSCKYSDFPQLLGVYVTNGLIFLFFPPDLLEKARVISQQTLERSYHIFYQMMSGSVNGLKGVYDLQMKNIWPDKGWIFFKLIKFSIQLNMNVTMLLW